MIPAKRPSSIEIRQRRTCKLAVVTALLYIFSSPSWGSDQSWSQTTQYDFTELPLEALMEITISSVSKKEQRLADSAAAIFVITQEDMRRSGVTTIADALRMVPGIQVARIDANKWAVSSRGFNSRFAGQMLVLFDGRVVYTPLFSGVFWDRQDTVLEDIDRIEVIRGPGAALWGANAVNGVINIITKRADETQGGLLTAGGGNEERGFGSIRYGFELNDQTQMRLYLKHQDRDNLQQSTGRGGEDAWHMTQGGFRLDSELTNRDSLTVQGDVYDGRLGETYNYVLPDYRTVDSVTEVFGANILSRWKRSFSDNADMALQLYYDRSEQEMFVIGEKRDTVDLDFQNRFRLGSSHELTWGLGYRYSRDSITNSTYVMLTPTRQSADIFSSFLQDDITLVPDKLHLIVGSKFEHNDYTGFEIQPTARLLWTPNRQHSLWLSASRAVRTPSRGERGFTLYNGTGQDIAGTPVYFQLNGSDRLKSDEMIAYELGYRSEPNERFALDAATFYNIYHQLDVHSQGAPFFETTPAPDHFSIPGYLRNSGTAHTWGFELAANAQLQAWWRLRAAYTYLTFVKQEVAADAIPWNPKGEAPHHQVSLRSSLDITPDIELDLWLRYVDSLPNLEVDSYLNLDARLAWKATHALELALVGQNLLHSQQLEFQQQILNTQPASVGRSIYGKVTWKF